MFSGGRDSRDLKQSRLLNVGGLADALGVSPVFIKRMKWAGFAMPGGRSTVPWALAWLKAHPDFRHADWTRPHRDAGHLAALAADK
jgi:hypothetical protein